MSGDQFKEKMDQDEPMAEAKPAPTPAPKPEPVPEPEPEPVAVDPSKEKADALKAEGNAHYKKKEFEAALAKYAAAYEAFDEDITYLNNTAAVYFEMGDFSKCRETCDKAVGRGRELRADYKLVAKALTRKGTSFKAENKLEEAMECYHKALTEHRSADTLKKFNETEKEIKKRDEEAYLDDDKEKEIKKRDEEAYLDD